VFPHIILNNCKNSISFSKTLAFVTKIYIKWKNSNTFTQLFIHKIVRQILIKNKNEVKMQKNVGLCGAKWGTLRNFEGKNLL